MPIWTVDVAGISRRCVEANSRDEALRLVRDQVIDALDLRAQRAPKSIESRYEASGPIQRKNLLAALDGLRSVRSHRDVRRELDRLQRWLTDSEEWTESQLAAAPPIAVERLDRVLLLGEIEHIESNMRRLREWEHPSPHHLR